MTNPRPNRPGQNNRTVEYKNGAPARLYQTFDEWQAVQELDPRTPEQRGIKIGAPVMWRHRTGVVITTDRATVLAISANVLTIQVNDVQTRTCDVNIHEIVNNEDDRLRMREANRRLYQGNRPQTPTTT